MSDAISYFIHFLGGLFNLFFDQLTIAEGVSYGYIFIAIAFFGILLSIIKVASSSGSGGGSNRGKNE